MTDCPTESDLSRFHGGELNEAEAARVRDHLTNCQTCSRRNSDLLAENEDDSGRVAGLSQPETVDVPPGDTPEAGLEPTWSEHDTISLSPSDWRGPADGDLAVPRELGSVRLIREIGRGGMGVVWLGRDQVLDRDVAVKLLLGAVPDQADPQFKQFLEGARAEASLKHPNIVSVYSAGVVSDLPYLVMDYVDGPSLRQVVKKVGPMSVATAVRTVSEVASAVSVLHGRGIVHRDLKPGNVLLDHDGQVLVTDFGLASLHRRGDQPLGAAGTPVYMAPEAFDGKASPQTDVYAMGMMLFELLGGSLAGVGRGSARRARGADEPLPLTGLSEKVPAQLLEIIERATHTQAIFRYKTAEHFQRALSESVPTDHGLRGAETELKTLVARSIAEQPPETPAPPSDKTPGSSYFDRLAEIAAKKRRASSPPAPANAPAAPIPHEMPDERRIAQDIPCVGCGYNLRSLSPTADCPECNEAVSSSLDSERLIFADPRWLSKVARGSTLFYGATFPLLWPSVLGLPLQVISLLERASFGAWLGDAMFVCVSTLILGAMTAGVVLTTAAERHRTTARWGKTARVLALLLCCGALAGIGLAGVGYFIPGVYMLKRSLYVLIWPGLVLLTVVALVLHLSGHARRIPDLKLDRRLRVVAVAFIPVCLPCVAVVVLPVTLRVFPPGYFTVAVAVVVFAVAIGLVWALVGSHRRTVKLAMAQAIPYHDLFGRAAGGGADECDLGDPVGVPGQHDDHRPGQLDARSTS